jgi:hypothetical protein
MGVQTATMMSKTGKRILRQPGGDCFEKNSSRPFGQLNSPVASHFLPFASSRVELNNCVRKDLGEP